MFPPRNPIARARSATLAADHPLNRVSSFSIVLSSWGSLEVWRLGLCQNQGSRPHQSKPPIRGCLIDLRKKQNHLVGPGPYSRSRKRRENSSLRGDSPQQAHSREDMLPEPHDAGAAFPNRWLPPTNHYRNQGVLPQQLKAMGLCADGLWGGLGQLLGKIQKEGPLHCI